MAEQTPEAVGWLVGGGATGQLIRSKDWSNTPLGPAGAWPQSLRVAVGICLNSRFPMFVWWGQGLINLYNDAYAPVLGNRHPDALGRPARSVWGEIWPVVGPQADAVMGRGEATWNERVLLVMERNGYAEDTYFTWSYSPIRDEAGAVAGLFCACTEETQRVRAEAERDCLAGQRQLALDAARMGWWHYDPLTRVARWDERYKEIFGVTGNQRANEEIMRRLHPDDVAGVWAAVEAALDPADPKPYATTYRIVLDDGSVRWVEAHGIASFEGGGASRRATSFVGTVADVTDRKRQEDALRGSEQRWQLAVRGTNDGVWDWDRATDAVYWSPRCKEMLGYADEELPVTREVVRELMHPDDRDDGWAQTRRHLAGQTPYFAEEYRLRHKDGSYRWVLARGVAVRDASGNPARMAGSHTDVTERKRTEDALRESERRFRFLSELGERTRDLGDPAEVMAAAARQLGEHLRASRCAYADVEGDSDRFTIRHDYTDGCASTAGEYRLSLFGPRAAADQRSGRTLVINDVDGELAPGEGADMFNAIAIKAVVCCPLVRAGRLVAMMAVHQTTPRRWTADEVGLVEAVVERSWAYVERARAGRALRRSEENLRRLADAMPQIVWAAGPDGVLDYYNRRWFEYVRRPDLAAAGLSAEAAWDRYIHPDDLPRAYEKWSACLGSGEPYAIEFRVRDGGGAYRWFLTRALPVRDDAGRVWRWYGTCTDVHDQKQLQAENERLLDRERSARADAERAGRMKDEFLSTLSHELRTPLNAILGWSQILNTGARDEDDLAEGLRTIERNARAQTQIIEDLLDMSRIISGKIRLDVQRVDLCAVVEAAVGTVRHAADARGVRLQTVLDPLAGPVSGDPGRLQQVFWNLLSNAVKFSPRGAAVRVLLGRVDSHLEVSVIDGGEGITPEFLPHVFDRFRQADGTTTRRHGGLGLGLSIVKQLVELHGGSVRARSAGAGRGATFTVMLPLTVLAPEPAAAGERRRPAARPALGAAPGACPALRGVKVLVVDDEPDARALVKRLLEDCEAVVFTAGSAAEAMEALRAEKPDVLVSDVGMPSEDGYALVRRIRALGPDGGGAVPAVALTAYARAEDRMQAVLAGFQMHLAKPVEPGELITIVASLAGRIGRDAAPAGP